MRYKETLAVTAIGASAIAGEPVWCIVCPVGAICRGIGANGIFAPIEVVILTTLAVAPEIKSRRWFCRNLCPVAGLINIISKVSLRGLKVSIDRNACIDCKLCSRVCPMGVDLVSDVQYDCILCLTCYEKCSKSAVKLEF